MKMSKRILAMLLAVLMVASVAPMSVMQAAAENITEAVSDLGDALAVNSAEEPAEAPEDTAPADEPEQTEEPAAEEPAASEPEQAEEPAEEPASAEEPAVEATTEAARKAPIKASGSEFVLDGAEEQPIAPAAEYPVYNNEIGALNGGIPVVKTVAVPAVLYKGAAENNADPAGSKAAGTVLQKYVYNYKTAQLNTANTAVRFVLPAGAELEGVSAKTSTAVGSVALDGTTLTMTEPTTTELENGDVLYTAALAENVDLANATAVVYAVTYTLDDAQKTIYAVSMVEELKVPAGVAGEDYAVTLTGDSVYDTALYVDLSNAELADGQVDTGAYFAVTKGEAAVSVSGAGLGVLANEDASVYAITADTAALKAGDAAAASFAIAAQSLDVNVNVYNKANLRKLVEAEMKAARGGESEAYAAWQQALVEAQAALANAAVSQAMINQKQKALSNAANVLVQLELGLELEENKTTPTLPAGEPTSALITKIDVPPTLYCDRSGNIFTSNGADGFSITDDKYYTAISVTTAANVSNVKLYLTDSSDSTGTQITLTQSGTTWSGSFPSGKSVSLDSAKRFGTAYYRLEYTYSGKVYTAYAASCVKVKYTTASAWIFQNAYRQRNKSKIAAVDGRYIIDVSEMLALKGVSALTSVYSSDSYGSINTSTASQPIDSFNASTYSYGGTNWKKPSNGIPDTAWDYCEPNGEDWFKHSGIDRYFSGTDGTVNSGAYDTKTNSAYFGTSVMINRGASDCNKHVDETDFQGLYASLTNSEKSNLAKDYIMAHIYYDPDVAGYSTEKAINASGTIRAKVLKGHRGPSQNGNQSPDKGGSGLDVFTESSMPGYNADYTNSNGIKTNTSWPSNVTYSDPNSLLNSNNPGSSNSTTYTDSTMYVYLKTTAAKNSTNRVTVIFRNYHYKDVGSGWFAGDNPEVWTTYGLAFAFNAVDRTNSHAQITDSLKRPVCKDDYKDDWWQSYRTQTWNAYYNCGNLFTQKSDPST